MPGTRSSKRRRAGSESLDEALKEDNITLDEEVTIPDGNVFLVAQRVAFRVHKSSLSRVSDVFRDLFALPPNSNTETLHGLPYVQVWDDPDDLRHLLLVVCCGKNYYYENDEVKPVPFRVLAALIRVGHKYAVQPVLSDALARLKKYYTSDLPAWLDVEGRNRFVSDVKPRDAATVIQLARLTNTPILLPTAYFIASRLMSTVHENGNELALSLFSPEDTAFLFAARIVFVKVAYARMMSLVTCLPSARCHSPQSCMKTALRALNNNNRNTNNAHEDKVFDLMHPWFWDVLAEQRSVCAECRAHSDDYDARLRSAMWNLLPAHFDLEVDGWPTNTEPIYK
ncbi:hypothetical protein K466DRAFT_522060 [Polyporus arcularius HHB13444]|uniref:BTB domain-containing protein n=1 Tax=Polyporus arcularius HHB13444 TaxID=1314778 RepID=A0A5C3PGC9_9APHY|nr:hypothetical protein K466DRAFT_522060 [Polyporus arcularius HHB13444]